MGHVMKFSDETDQVLVRWAQDGELWALDALLRRYRHKLFRQVVRLVRDSAEAEDVVQESMIAAFRSIDNFRGDSAFFTWLYRIAINIAKNNLLHAGRRLPLYSDLIDANLDNESGASPYIDTPDSILETRELLDLVSVILEDMPTEQRDALLLREVDGLTYEDIAIAMHCPIGTVRSRVHRARDFVTAAVRGRLG
jgi:RNA polymerase sigma-70 factor (ECF subfamily)